MKRTAIGKRRKEYIERFGLGEWMQNLGKFPRDLVEQLDRCADDDARSLLLKDMPWSGKMPTGRWRDFLVKERNEIASKH